MLRFQAFQTRHFTASKKSKFQNFINHGNDIIYSKYLLFKIYRSLNSFTCVLSNYSFFQRYVHKVIFNLGVHYFPPRAALGLHLYSRTCGWDFTSILIPRVGDFTDWMPHYWSLLPRRHFEAPKIWKKNRGETIETPLFLCFFDKGPVFCT